MLAQKKTENAIGLLFWLKLFDYRRIGGIDSFQQALKPQFKDRARICAQFHSNGLSRPK
jgi:hypothetical protein